MENGIVIKGKFYSADWIDDLVEIIVDKATEKVAVELRSHID